MPVSYIILGCTVLISMWALNDYHIFEKLKHWPYAESRRGEQYRWLTGGLLHGDYTHLLFNMMTLYFFGPLLEQCFQQVFPGASTFMFVLFYLLSIVAASSATYIKHKDNPHFASIGSSGATAAVLFACILFLPTIGIGLFFIPLPIPGFIFGILYLWYSSYAANRGGDNIDHTAHFYGALFGFLFPFVFKPTLLLSFFSQIMGWISNF
jgi:membrane associated rhomboid family serine protease